MGVSNPAKISLSLMGEFPSKKHWHNCYGTLLDNFLEIDAMIGDISFLWVCWSHFISSEREKAFLGPLLKKKRELGGTMFINKACILYKRLLGMQVQSKVRHSKFSQMEE
jgi:hypothetical protein